MGLVIRGRWIQRQEEDRYERGQPEDQGPNKMSGNKYKMQVEPG